MSSIAEITFRTVPEGGEENYSFVNFFLPNEELAKKAHKSLVDHGVEANFYWYTNNWHYINGWEHLRNVKSLGAVNGTIRHQLEKLNNTNFSKSDAIMSRTISSLVKVGWSEDEVILRAEKMRSAIAAVL